MPVIVKPYLSKQLCCFALFYCASTFTWAAPKEAPPDIGDLRWVDAGFLERQRTLVNDLTRLEFGAKLHGDKSDLTLLQRVLDKGLITQVDVAKQQALGVALGDVFSKELKLEWKTYTDDDGKSRAVCLKNTAYCLFPITMISKRASLGVTPNVQTLFEQGAKLIAPYAPKLPYQAPPTDAPKELE